MSWTKLGDEFADTARDLSDAAFRLHVEALGWSNRYLLDLRVPKRDLRKLHNVASADAEDAAKELVEAAWWSDEGDHWFIGVRWPDWQRDRVQVEHQRDQWSVRKMRSRRHKLDDHSLCLPDHCDGVTGDVTRNTKSRRDARRDPVSVSVSGRDGKDQPLTREEDRKYEAVLNAIADELRAYNGKDYDASWCAKVYNLIFNGQPVTAPEKYARGAIRKNPQRFIPTSQPPPIRDVLGGLP